MALGKSTQEFINFSIFEVTVETNGYQGGDAGHGAYLEVEFKDLSATYWECTIDNHIEKEKTELPRSVKFIFKGDAEIENFYESVKHIKKYLDKKLKKNL